MTLFDRAAAFAIEKHSGQHRKLSAAPYVIHPMEVATIAATITDDENVLAACLLHDTVEDTDATLEEIDALFGKRVALLVMTETEEKRPELPAEQTWALRKEESLIMLEHTQDMGVRILWLGDKLSNMRSFARQYRQVGDETWKHCNQKDPSKQAAYYRSIARSLSPLKEYDAYREFVSLVDEVFAAYGGAGL